MSSLRLTLRAWPVIAAATIGLCYLTQTVAGWFGIALPDQENIDLVRRSLGWNWNFVLLCAQVLLVMPMIEELIFRWLLWRLPSRTLDNRRKTEGRGEFLIVIVSSVLFSAAHYIFQPWPDAAFLALFFFGLAQCWLYKKSGRLWCAMLNHALFNLTNLILLFLIPNP